MTVAASEIGRSAPERSLRGRLALVAGAESAIGRELTAALLAAGAEVLVGMGGDGGSQRGSSTSPHESVTPFDLDASDIEGSITRLERAVGSRTIDLFVSATGAVPEADALLIDPRDLERTLAAHLYLPFALAQHVAARLVASARTGVIVLVGSETPARPAARTLARGVACAAAAHMAHCLAGEWRSYGIRTHMVAVREAGDGSGPSVALAAGARDVAESVLYLLSSAGSSLAAGHDLVLEPSDPGSDHDSAHDGRRPTSHYPVAR